MNFWKSYFRVDCIIRGKIWKNWRCWEQSENGLAQQVLYTRLLQTGTFEAHSTEMVNHSSWWLTVSQKLKNFKCFVCLKCNVWSGNKSNWLLTSREIACMCVLACVRACVRACGNALTVLVWHSHSHICYGFEKILKKDVVLTLQRPQKPECTILDYVKVNL